MRGPAYDPSHPGHPEAEAVGPRASDRYAGVSGRKMRTLLLADDSITVQRVIALTFANEQIQVLSCGDGPAAVERMAARRPDIVLAATTLPQMSGYELARFVRSQPGLRDVPVLLLSGAFETVDDAQLAVSGANGFIEKPFEPHNVIGRVKELLGLKSDARPAAPVRLITPADLDPRQRPGSTPPRAVTSMRAAPPNERRDQPAPEASTQPVPQASAQAGDYLDTLDGAFDSLDQQLSASMTSEPAPRRPSGAGASARPASAGSPSRRRGEYARQSGLRSR